MEKPTPISTDSTATAGNSAAVQVWKDFVEHFYAALQDNTNQSASLVDIYEKEYPSLIEQHYKNTPLPEWSSFEGQLEETPYLPFLGLLYSELYHRHIFQRNLLHLVKTSVRTSSFRTYSCLFVSIFPDSADATRTLRSVDLPPQVVWDIVDEYVYQFEKFNTYRAGIAATLTAERTRKSETGAPQRKRDEAVADVIGTFGGPGAASCWSPEKVLDQLHRMVDKSGVIEWSKKAAGDQQPPTTEMYFGYYAAVQLLRVYTILGDCNTALLSVSFIDPAASRTPSALWARVPAAFIHLHYYAALSQLLTRRPFDAIYLIVPALQYGQQRVRPHAAKGAAHEALTKRQAQLHHVLALALAACPVRLDDSVMTGLRDRLADRDLYARLQAAEPAAFGEAFTNAAPKFLASAPTLPALVALAEAHRAASDAYAAVEAAKADGGDVAAKEAALATARAAVGAIMDTQGATLRSGVETQRNIFVRELVAAAPVRALRAYFGLFSVATVAKLASFSEPPATGVVQAEDDGETDEEARMRSAMLLLRQRATQFSTAVDANPRTHAFSAPVNVQYLSDFDFSVTTDATGSETIRVTQVPFQASVPGQTSCRPTRTTSEWFAKQVSKLNELKARRRARPQQAAAATRAERAAPADA